ncbi:MAG: sigma-54-dependent Fis family transcriptional regulator [Desulfobacterales bacterium]|nr:sigma-54-dependent Fis family transcriptional regulator [Desulfobacterales bacterium]
MTEKLNPIHPIMVVDDEESILLSIDTTLRMAGFNNIITVGESFRVLGFIEKQHIELILLDLNMPQITGESLLSTINRDYPEIPVIIVTGAVDVETAVRCMKSGAFDYIVKPVNPDRLITAINRAVEFYELKQENLALKQHIMSDKLERPDAFSKIITNNKKCLAVFHYMESIAPTSQSVLITGETGVGKELFSRAIHILSNRKGEFVAVNAAGLDDNMFSDTLFGHVKGAFTGADKVRQGLIELATRGTLFLDEIGNLSPPSQVKLLRLLQESEYLPLGQDKPKKTDARIIAATNEELGQLAKDGKFRKDLIYRLQTHHVHIPPLRERLDDLPLLVDHFLTEASIALNKKKPTPPKELFGLLETYHFPGNIRELEAMIFDAVSRHKSKLLSLQSFKAYISQGRDDDSDVRIEEISDTDLMNFSKKLPTLKQATHILVLEAMRRANGVQSIAAEMLGISHQALSKRIKLMKDTIKLHLK